MVVGQKEVCHFYENLSDAEVDENRGSIGVTATGLVIKHEGKEYLLLEGLGKSKLFTDFVIWNLVFCLITFEEYEHLTMSGSIVLALPDALEHKVSHTFETINPLSELFTDQLFWFGEQVHLAEGTTGTIHLEDLEEWGVTEL